MAIAIANRYARALADVAGERGNYREVLEQIEAFAAVYRESPELREVFTSPALPVEKKTKVLLAITARLGAAPVTVNFLRVLLAHYRMGLIEFVCRTFRKIVNDRLGVVAVEITSATALSEAEQQALRARFTQLTEKQVVLRFQLSPELVGGVVAQIQSTVYDGSVRGQLDRLRAKLQAQ